jgi:transketolase
LRLKYVIANQANEEKNNMKKANVMNLAADNIRILSASMVEKAKSGHPGGAMGGADFINVLYSKFLVHDPEDPAWDDRDRFFLDPGHMSPMLYSVLALAGRFSLDDLKQFRQWGSITPGHPEVDIMHGIENTSGPLGQGHTYAVGAAIAARFRATRTKRTLTQKIYAYISDGGIQEEISQGAARIAGHLGLNNLILFYDSNDIQLSTTVNAVTSENTALKYRAWNWQVFEINGNDESAITEALTVAQSEKERPVLIIGKTVMGKGARKADGSSYENNCATHGMPLGEAGASFEETIRNLGGDPSDPFRVFPEVEQLYKERAEALKKIVAEKRAEKLYWESCNPEKALQLDKWLERSVPDIEWDAIEQKPNQSTRAASSTILGLLAQKVENMIVASADLSNSDKTDGFLKQTKAITKDDFSGAFLQAGVSELTMACLCIGMALYGGVIPACGTFFVFSDYMKPAIRMAALMELPVIFIWTHDAFRVGEDGPTHEPVEQEAQIRLMEKLKNHKGQNSMLVLRPADVHEATVSWKLALENTHTPTGLIFSRQNITDLPAKENRYQEALQTAKGGYIVSDDDPADVILLASGSEVSTLAEGAALLREDGIKVRVVSIPSEGLFRSQTKEYQESVLIPGKKIFGLTAGLPVNLLGLVGSEGKIWGLESFGFSAPYKVLDEKLGFTGENVRKQVKLML